MSPRPPPRTETLAEAEAEAEPGPAVGRRKRSPRFDDIAQAAGVSASTVNRVLNELGSVAPATRERVVAAARALAVPRVLPDTRHGLTRLDVVLTRSDTPFFRRLELALARAGQMLDRRVLLQRLTVDVSDADGEAGDRRLAEAIARHRWRRDGLLVLARDSTPVREALRAQRAAGVPVALLMSEIATLHGAHYAGIDNLQAGRCAGHLLARLNAHAPPGSRVLVITNALSFRAHADRVEGCRAALAQHAPQLALGPAIECHDDADRCHLVLREALAGPHPPVAVYATGAGGAGIAAALRQARAVAGVAGTAGVADGTGAGHRGPAPRIAWIGHELSDEHRASLREGLLDLVIDQAPDDQVAGALQHLLHACGHVDAPPERAPTEFRLFSAEHLPRGAGPSYLDAPLGGHWPRL
ncbi:MAG: hypothetical protein RL223_82 [Pseudomonadota bacterium]